MKISNSKKQLAKIISENGGWRAAAGFAVQDKKRGAEPFAVVFYTKRPQMPRKGSGAHVANPDGAAIIAFSVGVLITNWHQTILSRDEYFHLYPAPDADGWIEWEGGLCPVDIREVVDIQYREGTVIERADAGCFEWQHYALNTDIIAYRLHKQEHPHGIESMNTFAHEPTIEQLATEYRNRKDYAERKQQEADEAKVEAEAALSRLIIACADLGFEIKPKVKLESSGASVIDKLQDKASELSGSELNITDWRRLHAGDVIWLDHGVTRPSGEYEIKEIEKHKETCRASVMWNHVPWWADLDKIDWRFIRRP